MGSRERLAVKGSPGQSGLLMPAIALIFKVPLPGGGMVNCKVVWPLPEASTVITPILVSLNDVLANDVVADKL